MYWLREIPIIKRTNDKITKKICSKGSIEGFNGIVHMISGIF